jgi:uncharacterized protein YegL
VIKFVSDLRQVGGFLHVFWFLPQNNLNIVEIGIKHYKTNKQLNLDYDAENVNHIMPLQMKTMTTVLKILTSTISSITALLIGLAVILAIMSVSTFKTDVIQYLLKKIILFV